MTSERVSDAERMEPGILRLATTLSRWRTEKYRNVMIPGAPGTTTAGQLADAIDSGLIAEMRAAAGHLRNAKIDLETGATKATAIRTIEGGLRRLEAAIAAQGGAS